MAVEHVRLGRISEQCHQVLVSAIPSSSRAQKLTIRAAPACPTTSSGQSTLERHASRTRQVGVPRGVI